MSEKPLPHHHHRQQCLPKDREKGNRIMKSLSVLCKPRNFSTTWFSFLSEDALSSVFKSCKRQIEGTLTCVMPVLLFESVWHQKHHLVYTHLLLIVQKAVLLQAKMKIYIQRLCSHCTHFQFVFHMSSHFKHTGNSWSVAIYKFMHMQCLKWFTLYMNESK